MQLNAKQVVLIILAVLGFTATGISQLEPVIGHSAVVAVQSISSFIGGMMAAAMAPFLSNNSIALDAKGQAGVSLQVDRTADPKLLAAALNPSESGIAPAPGEAAAIAKVVEDAKA